MSELRTIFRRCPNCGRRFEIHITGMKLVDEKFVSDEFKDVPMAPSIFGGLPIFPAAMTEGIVTVDEKEFQYAYECKHCGHKWFEMVEKDDETTTPNRTEI